MTLTWTNNDSEQHVACVWINNSNSYIFLTGRSWLGGGEGGKGGGGHSGGSKRGDKRRELKTGEGEKEGGGKERKGFPPGRVAALDAGLGLRATFKGSFRTRRHFDSILSHSRFFILFIFFISWSKDIFGEFKLVDKAAEGSRKWLKGTLLKGDVAVGRRSKLELEKRCWSVFVLFCF